MNFGKSLNSVEGRMSYPKLVLDVIGDFSSGIQGDDTFVNLPTAWIPACGRTGPLKEGRNDIS